MCNLVVECYGLPWLLSIKAPVEPLRKSSLKHFTFKIILLLVLASGKRRNETQAWVIRDIRHREDWFQVFPTKNQHAREGPEVWHQW